MPRLLNTFEFVDGTRNSGQIFFKNQLNNKYLGVQLRCIQSKCLSTLSVDIESMAVTKGPDAHNAHVDILDVRLAVMREIKRKKK